jgi:hypothetical protein
MFLRKGTPDPKGCFVSFMVGDADALYEFHRSQGVEVVEPIDDRPYGIRDYGVRDLHGYHLSFGHPLFNSGPPIKIERVDVPVRLEKRPAALLLDLAKHKRMSREQLPRRNAATYERWCWTAHTNNPQAYPGVEEEARNRLRLARQLPV